MANGKELFKTNANTLLKVLVQLNLSQSMSYRHIILGESNQRKLLEAAQKVADAINILRTIR